MYRTLVSFFMLLCAVPAIAATCDPAIRLDVNRPYGSEAEPTVVSAKAISGCPVTVIRVYVDDKRVYEQRGGDPINARVVMGAGNHHVVIKAWNTAGSVAREDRYVTSTADPVEPISGCECGSSLEWGGDHLPYVARSPIYIGMCRGGATSIRLYIDGINRAQTFGSSGHCLPAGYLFLKPGYHFINLEAWDANGFIYLSGSIVEVAQ